MSWQKSVLYSLYALSSIKIIPRLIYTPTTGSAAISNMRNGFLLLLFLGLLATACARQAPSLLDDPKPYDAPLPNFSTPVTLEEVRLAFYKYSVSAIVRKLMEKDGANWNMIMEKIAQGDAQWIQYANKYISPGTDAGSTDDYLEALALALQHNPAAVLSLEQVFGRSLLDVCSLPFIEPEYAFIKNYGEKALAALRMVDFPYYEESRDTCIRRMQKSLADCERIYKEGRWVIYN